MVTNYLLLYPTLSPDCNLESRTVMIEDCTKCKRGKTPREWRVGKKQKNRRRRCHGGSVIDSMESSATDCKEMSRGEHANRHDVRFVANLARNLGGCDQDIFGKISISGSCLLRMIRLYNPSSCQINTLIIPSSILLGRRTQMTSVPV